MEEYYLLYIIFPLILGLWAQFLVHSKYNKWSQVRSAKGLRGRDAAAAVMEQAGIHDVEIVRIEGKLTDHYDPIHRRLALSRDNYDGTSLAALGISAHEAGHAIQHKEMYAPLQWRSALIPITNISCQLLPFVIFGGFFLNFFGLIWPFFNWLRCRSNSMPVIEQKKRCCNCPLLMGKNIAVCVRCSMPQPLPTLQPLLPP